jgi:hypothetical protein
MKNLINEIKNWKYSWLKYFIYSYKQTIFIYTIRWNKFIKFLGRHNGIVKRICILVVSIILGSLINHWNIIAASTNVLSNYLISVGVMIGGTIAIVFSISIFLSQGVADLYSSKHFESYINSWKEQLIYTLVILITLSFFSGGLYIGKLIEVTDSQSSYIILVSLFLIGITFSLIDWQFEIVRKKIKPVQGVLFLAKKGKKSLETLQYNALKVADLIMRQDENKSKETALASAYNHVFQSSIADFDSQLETLFEISLRLANRHEVETAKIGLEVIHNLIVEFLKMREKSSLIIHSSAALLALESDSQNFLARNFDRFNKAGEKSILEGKEELTTHIINIYNSFATHVKDFEFIGQVNENPILSQVLSYLIFLVETGERLKNIEVVFQGVKVVGNIGIISIEKALNVIDYSVQENLLKIAKFGLAEKCTVIVDRCIENYIKIINTVIVSNKSVPRMQLKEAFNNIAIITNLHFFYKKQGYIVGDITNSLSLSKPYDELYTNIAMLMNVYLAIDNEDDKNSFQSKIIKLFDKLYSSLRWLSENIKNSDDTLVDSVGRLVFNINNLIIESIQ